LNSLAQVSLASMSAKWAFIDESKSKDYIIAATIVEARTAPGIRKILQGLRMKGQRRIHFATESDQRRKLILSKAVTLQCSFIVARSAEKSELDARREALSRMARFLLNKEVTTIVLELDESMQVHDRRTLDSVVKALNPKVPILYRHESPFLEPLLWLPDMVVWVTGRGDNWAFRLPIEEIKALP
jgi:hypothetical protein